MTEQQRLPFHEKCLKVAKEIYGKKYGDLEDAQCTIVSKIVRMDIDDTPTVT